jgi:hypothetical protein
VSIRAEDIRLEHRVIGTKHVFTSPDVPELHISHADEATARADIQPALDALDRIKQRIEARRVQAKLLDVA